MNATAIHSGRLKSGPWLLEASRARVAARLRLPEVPSKGLDALGITQRKLNGNFMSWMNELSDQDKHEGNQWYPTGNEWGHHAAELHNVHPDKVFGVMSKTSPQRDWYANLGDTENVVGNHKYSPENIVKPGGISGTNNLQQALRVMDAPDDPESIHSAFLGTKNVQRQKQPVAVPRAPGDLPKTYDFMRTLRNPEEGGAHNYAQQPGVVDSWMGRSMLWSKKAWDEAQAGGKPLTWPGQGTGEGLDKHLPVKKPNPVTGQWEVVGTKPPSARDVAGRVTGMAGGYDRMRNAMRNGAAAHDMPFTHGAQAAVWKSISGNQNPSGIPNHDVDPFYIEHPGERWDEMWNRRAGGPQQAQNVVAHRTAAHGSREIEDSLDETWGTPKDFADILKHISTAPLGWDHWEDRPGLITLDYPHPRTSSWYITADDISTTGAPAGVDDNDNDKQQAATSQMPTLPGSQVPGVPMNKGLWSIGPVAPMTMNPNLPSGMTDRGVVGPGNYGGGGGSGGGGGVSHSQASPGFSSSSPSAPHVPPAPAGAGGVAAATALAQGANGNPYDYGGAGNGHYDCSGYQSDVYNALTGKPLGQRQFSTTSDFGALGFQPGFDPKSTYNIGVNPNPGMSGHMVGLLNGVNLESGGAADKTQYGGAATGPLDPEFSRQYHLPNSMIVPPVAKPPASPAASAPAPKKAGRNWYITATDWGAMPDAQVMGPAAPPGFHHGPTPTSPWSNSVPASSSGGGSGPSSGSSGSSKPAYPGGSGEQIATPSASGPPSKNLTDALGRAGIDPALNPLISGFSATEGNNPSGAPTLGFTDSQAGTTLDQHAQALAQQFKDRAPVAGPPPIGKSPQDQASWMATVVGQGGSPSDWQGHAQPARSDYVNRVVQGMPSATPPMAATPSTTSAPATTTTTSDSPGTHSSSIHSGRRKSGPWLLEASRHATHDNIFDQDNTGMVGDVGVPIDPAEYTQAERNKLKQKQGQPQEENSGSGGGGGGTITSRRWYL